MSITTEKVVEIGEKKLLELMKEKSNSHIDPDKVKRKQKIRCDCRIASLFV